MRVVLGVWVYTRFFIKVWVEAGNVYVKEVLGVIILHIKRYVDAYRGLKKHLGRNEQKKKSTLTGLEPATLTGIDFESIALTTRPQCRNWKHCDLRGL